MADTEHTSKPVTITDAPPFFGRTKGSVRIHGDILAPLDVQWTVLAEDVGDLLRHAGQRPGL
jgi:hypothetical protein